MRNTRKRALALVAGLSSVALLATACGGNAGDDPEDPGTGADDGTTDEEITLTISTFN